MRGRRQLSDTDVSKERSRHLGAEDGCTLTVSSAPHKQQFQPEAITQRIPPHTVLLC